MPESTPDSSPDQIGAVSSPLSTATTSTLSENLSLSPLSAPFSEVLNATPRRLEAASNLADLPDISRIDYSAAMQLIDGAVNDPDVSPVKRLKSEVIATHHLVSN